MKTLYILVTIIILSTFGFCLTQDGWKDITDYKSLISITKYKIDEGFEIILEPSHLNYFINDPNYPDFNYGTLNRNEYVCLSKYMRKYLPYRIPKIVEIIKTPILKKHKLVYVKDMLNSIPHDPGFYFSIEENGKSIHRFGKLEIEFGKGPFRIKRKDIKYFNRMLKKDKQVLENPVIALNILMIFLRLSKLDYGDVLLNPEKVDANIKKKCGKIFSELMKDRKKKFYKPKFLKKDNIIELCFMTHSLIKTSLILDEWKARVSRNGKISLLENSSTLIDFSRDCKTY
jgi:hypothetical protein